MRKPLGSMPLYPPHKYDFKITMPKRHSTGNNRPTTHKALSAFGIMKTIYVKVERSLADVP